MASLRRFVTIAFWPSIDIIVTFFANFMLVRFNAMTAAFSTALLAMSLNFAFLHLLFLEKELQAWVNSRARRLLSLGNEVQKNFEVGKFFTVIVIYAVSGPAMVGAPLIWLLGIKGLRAYSLIVLGTLLNSLIWVGGIYNAFWLLIREIASRI